MKINLKCMHVHALMLLLGIIYLALLGLSMSAAALGVIFLVFPTYYHWLGALNVVLCPPINILSSTKIERIKTTLSVTDLTTTTSLLTPPTSE